MRAIPYALSVHHFISSVGADAGFAAIIGLAVVVLLFFAHARETANLRHRADEAEDALHRLEQYVDQLARAGAAPPPAVAQPSPPAAAPAFAAAAAPAAAARAGAAAPAAGRTVAPARPPVAAMAMVQGAPAGVGAPALNAATRLIPIADDAAIAIHANRSDTTFGAGAPATGATAAAVMDPPAPPPSTSAGGANGNRVPPAPPPASAGQTLSGRERLPGRAGAARPAAAATTGRGGRGGQRPGGRRVGRGAIVLATALLVVVVVGVLLVVINSNGGNGTTTAATHSPRSTSTASSKSKAKATTKAKAKAATTVTPNTVTVAVLNGTSTPNLAHDISTKLQAAGYKPGQVATATDQTQSSTIVGYLPAGKADALAVAKSLRLGPASVQAVDSNNRAVACNGSTTSCPAQVVVTVGTDLASNA